ACDGQTAKLREIDPASALLPGYRLPARQLDLGAPAARPLAAALVAGRAVGDRSQGYAVAIVSGGRTVAALDIGGFALDLPATAVRHTLNTLAVQLSWLGARDTPAAPDQPTADAGPHADGGPDSPPPQALPLHLPADMIEAMPVAVFVFASADLRLLAMNRRAETEFHLRRSSMLSKTLVDAFHPVLSQAAEPVMRRAVAERCELACDHDWSTRRGTRTVHVHHVVLTDADGEARWLLSTAREVTEERRARRELVEARSVLDQFADTVSESLFVSNLDRSKFQFLAGSLYERWGVTPDQMQRDPGAFLSHVIDEDRRLLDERRAKEEALVPADVVFRIRHPAKGVRWLRSRTRSLRMPDGEIRVFGLVSDVTDDKVRQEELRRTRDAAEAASTAKSQFMANMSHEIRTPMNGILGMTELLLGTRLADEQRRFAQAVYRSGESLLEIINNILDFSKIEAGRLELARMDFFLRGLVEDTLELLAPRAQEKGLDVIFLEGDGLPQWVHGDALRLQQVLTNLVANAIKFTQSGEVAVELRRLPPPRPSEPDDGLWLEFEVRDTGIGIEPDVLPRLFNAFTQASGDMSRRYGGTGLGLAISKQLVELMGGDIRVASAPGQGSRFCFNVLVQPAQPVEEDAVTAADEASLLAVCRVLVVADRKTNRLILENMLGSWGTQVTLASDGHQALDLLRDRHRQSTGFDVALVDMQMPRLDGLAFARARQQEGLCPQMRLIMLSSASSPDDARDAQLAGFQRFLLKPCRRADLRQALLNLASPVHHRELHETAPLLQGSVLVVEDNKVNQEVIGQMLRNMGVRVQMASGAMQGLRLLCEAHFDLVLMDIMMP
ncbi:MAG TPA: response regulator, partial [Rubrivivax sp.]|nr:response regulator [Rubrivivax sp.]